jgi:hypothetical protein
MNRAFLVMIVSSVLVLCTAFALLTIKAGNGQAPVAIRSLR